MPERYFQTGQGRVFMQSEGANPGNPTLYLGCARLTGFTHTQGAVTPVRCPSEDAYDSFDVQDVVRGASDLPTTSLVGRFGLSNVILTEECPFHLQAHFGKCGSPTHFNLGWEKILAWSAALFTSKSSDDLTALDEDQRNPILLTGEVTGQQMWIINRLTVGEKAAGEVTREVIKIFVNDYLACGDCGWSSGGCERVYAITRSSGSGSPGLPAELLVSEDGGNTWTQYDITTLATDEQPSDGAVMGDWLIVVSEDSGSLHYAHVDDLTTWYETNVGIVGAPIAIWVQSATDAWIVGAGGYIYYTQDITGGVEVQDAGVAASGEDLNDVMAVSSMRVVAVGDAGTVVFTVNGGAAWSAAADSPTIANLNVVAVRTDYTWVVGSTTGYIFYTRDAGASWYQSSFLGMGTGQVFDMAFSKQPNSPFGFMAHDEYVLRTIDGGQSWYRIPITGYGSLPANTTIGTIGTCRDPNVMYGGGLAVDSTDGIIIKAA